MENNLLNKKIITAKEAAEISNNNNYDESLLESQIMPQIKMQANKGLNHVSVILNIDKKDVVAKIVSKLKNLGYNVKAEKTTFHIGW